MLSATISNTEFNQIDIRSYHKADFADYDETTQISRRHFDDGSSIRINRKHRSIIIRFSNGEQFALFEY
jgi:hypothetical protein